MFFKKFFRSKKGKLFIISLVFLVAHIYYPIEVLAASYIGGDNLVEAKKHFEKGEYNQAIGLINKSQESLLSKKESLQAIAYKYLSLIQMGRHIQSMSYLKGVINKYPKAEIIAYIKSTITDTNQFEKPFIFLSNYNIFNKIDNSDMSDMYPVIYFLKNEEVKHEISLSDKYNKKDINKGNYKLILSMKDNKNEYRVLSADCMIPKSFTYDGLGMSRITYLLKTNMNVSEDTADTLYGIAILGACIGLAACVISFYIGAAILIASGAIFVIGLIIDLVYEPDEIANSNNKLYKKKIYHDKMIRQDI